MKEVWTPGTGK